MLTETSDASGSFHPSENRMREDCRTITTVVPAALGDMFYHWPDDGEYEPCPIIAWIVTVDVVPNMDGFEEVADCDALPLLAGRIKPPARKHSADFLLRNGTYVSYDPACEASFQQYDEAVRFYQKWREFLEGRS